MILRNSFLVLLGYNSGNAWSQSISKQAHQLGAVLGHGGIPIVFISIHGVVTHSLMFRSFVYRYTRTQPEIVTQSPFFGKVLYITKRCTVRDISKNTLIFPE